MEADWSRLQEIFDEAWALEPEARRALIVERCAGDPELQAEVERMVAAFDEESRATTSGTGIRARALSSLGSGLFKMGCTDEARSILEKGLALAQEDPGQASPLAARLMAQLKKMK